MGVTIGFYVSCVLHAFLHEPIGGDRSVKLSEEVHRMTELYTFIPVTLGLRQPKMPYKASAFLHALCWQLAPCSAAASS